MAFTEMTARTLKRPRQPWTSEGALSALDACDVFVPFIGFNLVEVVRTLTAEGTAGCIGEADPAIGIAKVALVDGGLSCLACLVGSDVHVMLALHGSFQQVIVTDEHFDGTNMIDEFLGERQRLAHQTCNPLS